jgi:hypothetical protein
MMQHTRPKLQQALSLGVASFLLTFALFARPLLASLQDFAHVHQEATAFHIHNLNSGYTGHVSSALTTLIVIWIVIFFILQAGITSKLTEAPRLTYSSRAPPHLNLKYPPPWSV